MRRRHGFTLIESMIVVFIVGLLAGIGVPNFLKAREETHKNLCINNLRRIEAAKEQWALINNKTQGESANESEVNAFLKADAPCCPAGGVYTYGIVGETPQCSLAASQGHTILPVASQQEQEEEEGEKEGGAKGHGKGRGKGRGRGNGRGSGGG